MTDAERTVWTILREHFAQWRFRRQVPLGPFIADFVSHRAKLVIEVDGGQHGGPDDTRRDAILNGEGYRVLRFWNSDALANEEAVFRSISKALAAQSPPSRLR